MTCLNCGGQIADGAAVCPLCGAAQPAVQNPAMDANAYHAQQPGASCPGYQPVAAARFEPSKSKTAQTLGIVGLCMQYFNLFPLASLILCIMGLVTANQSRALSDGEYSPSAKVGRICGIIGIALAAAKVVALILCLALAAVLFGSLAGLLANMPAILDELPEFFRRFEEEFLMIAPAI